MAALTPTAPDKVEITALVETALSWDLNGPDLPAIVAVKAVLSARWVRLGIELRKLRERAGLSVTEAARSLGTVTAQISNIESCRYGISAERVRALARNYDCADDALVEALVEMATDRKQGWWEQYRELLPAGLLDLAELEAKAKSLHVSCTVHMPGLLQTPDHAREVFRNVVPALTPPEVEHRASHRIKRQEIIYREQPTPYNAIVHEAALRMQFGGPTMARGQLQHLAEMSEHAGVTLRVVPFAAGSFPGSGQSFSYAEGPVPQLDTVQLDQSHGPSLSDQGRPVAWAAPALTYARLHGRDERRLSAHAHSRAAEPEGPGGALPSGGARGYSVSSRRKPTLRPTW